MLKIQLIVGGTILALILKRIWPRHKGIERAAILVLFCCVFFISFSVGSVLTPKRTITVTALHEKSEWADNSQIYLKDVVLNNRKTGVPEPAQGRWSWYNGLYCWFEEGDERRAGDQTESVTFELPFASKTQLVFVGNHWKGIASVRIGNETVTVDTFREGEDGVNITVPLPVPRVNQMAKAVLYPVLGFLLSLALGCGASLYVLNTRLKTRASTIGEDSDPFRKLLKHQFLFEELVARDFKKKYKRTALGMGWSLLSPLLTLLVMRVVFTQFFGRNMAHYTTYLFCGNLVFSYFNEATSQGMTSLTGNADIFTKVNVPKYLFLFSKNIQTLLNFGLTLCVFFVFCMIDKITFTWRFCLLLYPIVLLLLFNIGIGLILSALFVFFRDVQYLWSVFTQLLMYVSAIFYTIDNYSDTIRKVFLLNPVYLFIRYFRKIVMEATIPTVWFHLLMLADVAIVLGIGCWMYKKYNTQFLYYV